MKENKHGFTLAELLVVIAIMMILAGVSFVGISRYIRNLHLVEMDNAAKEIFIVAQNHLSQAYASGEYMREDVSYYGTKFESKPNYLSVPDDAKAEYYYVVFKGYPAGNNNKPGVLGTMLPQYSIEEEIADYGNYLIVYEKNSATVVSVFYSGRSHTYFGSSPVHEFVAGSEEVKGNVDEHLKEAVGNKENRKHYLSENSVIGWYGSNGKKVVPSEAFNSIKLEITNGSRLTATVTNPNYDAKATNQKLNLIVKGLTSGKEKILSLENYSKVDWKGGVDLDCKFDSDCILDDITSLNSHFCNKFPEFTPGEDVEIYAELSDTSRFVAPIKSNVCVVNSLFESYSDNESLQIAEIKNIRHLENLDPNVSNLGVTVTKAEQLDDLVYGGSVLGTTSFAEDITGASGNNGQAISIYSLDDAATNPLSDKGYYGIYNSKLQAYDGQNHSIINIYSVTGDSGNTGIFAETGASGFEFRNLTVLNSSFKGLQNSGGLVGHSIGLLKIRNCKFKGDDSIISASSGDAGAMVGLCDGALTVSNCEVKGDNLKISGKNAGGMIGNSSGAVTMSSCSAIGKNAMISGENAGGIMGISNGGLNITNSYSSSFVFATAEDPNKPTNANAGGFIGNINTGSENHIVNCYSSGHTTVEKINEVEKHGRYGKGTDTNVVPEKYKDNFNVISSGAAGGFIGKSSVKATIYNSYSTCSAYSSSNSGYSGGFVGISIDQLSVNNCYSIGLVSSVGEGKAGGFIGYVGVNPSTIECYYLKGKGFNSTLKAIGFGGLNNSISSTSGNESNSKIKPASNSSDDAVPWDEIGSNYPYNTIEELYVKQNSDPKIPLPVKDMKKHYGDWTEVEASPVSLSISNAEKLEAIISIPNSNLESAGDYFVSMAVEGIESGKIAYAQMDLRSDSITIIGSDVALANIVAVEGNEKIADSGNILFLDALSYSIKTVSDDTEFHIYLDDITTAGGNFAKIFTDFIPGEDIRITAESGFLSWSTLIGDAIDYETADGLGSEVKITGITNSLFASGSGNNNYSSKTYYSDIYPDKAIVDPVNNVKDAFKNTALIGNFRHLQNLDKYISNVDNTYTKAKVYRDLYWNPSNKLWEGSNATDTNGPKTGYKDFISAIGGSEVKIYAYDNVNNAVTSDNSFFGIINPNLQEFDGQNCSINNVVISNINSGSSDSMSKDNPDAGIFRYLNPSNNILIKNVTINYISVNSDHGHAGGLIGSIKLNANTNTTINNVNISEPVVLTTSGHAGGLIGYANVNNSSELKADYTYIYGEKALVRTLATDNHSAGGFIGAAVDGAYTIKNCGASTYVYADTATCAGGFIGDFKPKATTNIEDCFVGGHVQDGTEVYINNQAVVGAGTEINNEGGFNVCGKVATGGFIGYIGTSDNTSFTFKNCFTTASVHAENGKSGPDSQSGATGGFIGRMQNKGQKYHNCYAAGKIFSGNSYAGAFVGHYSNGANKPEYKDDYVLQGEGFNDDQGLKYVNFGSSEGYEISGISFAAYDSDGIKNKSGEYIVATTFNRKTDNQYPYRDTATGSSGLGVFYGDWVVPERLVPVVLRNDNRLTASIFLKKNSTMGDEEGYNVTYVRIIGDKSKKSVYFRIRYKDGEVESVSHIQVSTLWFVIQPPDDTLHAVYVDDGNPRIDFYIDNISAYNENYRGTMSWYGSAVPGEDITVYVSDTLDGVKSNDAWHVKGNSLFESIEENTDGNETGITTYTACISNSRNLQNLDNAVSGIDAIVITRAVQTDNIYWRSVENNGGTGNQKARTRPYLDELPNAKIYEDNAQSADDYLTAPNKMYSIYHDKLKLKEYDGGNYTIYGMILGRNPSSGDCAGLFAKTKEPLTINNLTINNLTIDNPLDKPVSKAGALVGVSTAAIELNNVTINGTVKVSTGDYAGGLIGESTRNVTMTNVSEVGDITIEGRNFAGGIIGKTSGGTVKLTGVGVSANSGRVSKYDTNSWWGSVGGLIGETNDTKLDINNCHSSILVDGYGKGAGGFIGNIENSSGTIQNSYSSGTYGQALDNNDIALQVGYNVIGEGNYSIGGFIGNSTTKYNDTLIIQNCYSGNSVASAKDRNESGDATNSNPYYIGGFIGIIDSNVQVNSCYSLGYIKVRGSIHDYYGCFVGKTAGSSQISNSSYIPLYDNNGLNAIGSDGNTNEDTINAITP